jgi:acetyl/propionyl-CoA carboxylase alpha subunit
MKWITLEIHGRRQRVPAIKAQGKLWFHWLGETHVVDVGGAARRAGSERGKGQPGVIQAPMPGKITKVATENGARVRKGEALVVMEAMKMEYTLEADRDGIVNEVLAQPGQQVALGTVLVRVGEA